MSFNRAGDHLETRSVSQPDSSASFVGVDLAWASEGNNTGLAAFHGNEEGADAVHIGEGRYSLDSIVDFILANQAETTVVAIDAPLIISNHIDRRPCESEISRRFGKAHAGAHSSNLSLYPNARSVQLAQRFEGLGFRHCRDPGSRWSRDGKWFFEVYPHPAQVVFFERDFIIRYKKGRVDARRSGLEELRTEIRVRILGNKSFRQSLLLNKFLTTDLNSLRGQTLKCHEDALDAIVCSFLAFHLWRWGWERSEMVGDLETGYIVVPTVALPKNTPT
jgi:predicted RNase H-like nuclease